jgi:hypothetical protein
MKAIFPLVTSAVSRLACGQPDADLKAGSLSYPVR